MGETLFCDTGSVDYWWHFISLSTSNIDNLQCSVREVLHRKVVQLFPALSILRVVLTVDTLSDPYILRGRGGVWKYNVNTTLSGQYIL